MEPGVLLWPFIEYLCISVFHIARLSQAFSCGHLLNICVFPYCSFEPGVLLWPFIEYLCVLYCSFEPGVLLWPFTEYFGGRLPAETPGAFCRDFTLVSSLPCQGFYILFCNTILDEIEL